MPDSPICLAPTHMCLDSCWTLSKIRKDQFLLGFAEGFPVRFGFVPFVFPPPPLPELYALTDFSCN